MSLFVFACANGEKPMVTVDQVHKSWQEVTLKTVKNADVMDMVVAFQKQWPTNAVAMFLEDIKLPEEQQQYLSFYDPKSRYLSFAEGSDDRDAVEIEAYVWLRTNGHQLFGIELNQQSSAVKAFMAFYDYDPAKGTLVPEKNMADFYTSSYSNVILGYSLDLDNDDLLVNEYFMNWWMPLIHRYHWDGMKFSKPETLFDGMYDALQDYFYEYMTYEMEGFSKYTLIDIDEDGEPEIWVSSDNEEYQGVLSVVEGNAKLIAATDFKRHLIFYKGAVGDAGGCGTGCFYARYTKLKNSAPEYEFTDMTLYNYEKDKTEDEYSVNGETISEKEALKIFESFGDPLDDPKVEWRDLVQPKG